MPDETNAQAQIEQPLDDVLAHYIAGEEAGSAPNRQELLARYPQLAGELREFFANRDQMQRLAQPLRGGAEVGRAGNHPLGKVRYFGDYELLEEVAAGGMGIIYKARQRSLNRIVAVKMILKGTLAREDDVKRFRAEAEAAASLQHPAIVAIHEVGLHEGQHYFSMDFVDGHSLAELPREQPLAARQAAEYVRDAAEAVHYAHQQGTLHRDLKPSNILIDRQGRVRITDFGLAKRIEGNSDLTLTGQILGTPSYMPPEQASGKRSLIAAGSDIYSLGAVLYELLTGRPPFRGESPAETLRQVESTEPVSPRLLNPAAPRDLETICLKCLEKEPHKRYGTAQLLADDLERWIIGKPILARRTSVLGRAWRWTKRKPAVAALTAVSTAAAILFIIGLAVSNRLILQKERQTAVANALLSEQEEATRRVNDELRRKEEETSQANQRLAESLESEKLVQSRLTSTNESLRTSMDREQRATYGRSVNLANQHLLANDVNQAEAILEECRPEELRGWEWRYLRRQIKPSGVFSLRGYLGHGGVAPFSPDGKRLAALMDDRTLRIVDLPSGNTTAILRGHGRTVTALAFSPDGKRIAAAGLSLSANFRHQVSVWDVDGGHLLWIAPISATGLAFSPDGHRLAVSVSIGNRSQEHQITIHEADSGRPAQTFPVRPGRLLDLAYSPNGKYVASAGAFGVWSTDTGEPAFSLPLPLGSSESVAFSPDGKLLATGGLSGSITIWEMERQSVMRVIHAHAEHVHSLSFHRDSHWLASASNDRSAKVWDVATGKELYAVRHASLGFCAAAFSPDGEYLATATWGTGEYIATGFATVTREGGVAPGEVRIWHASSGPSARTLAGHRGAAWGVTYNSDGSLIATAGEDKAVLIWESATGKQLWKLQGHEDFVCGVAFEPGGKVVASASRDKTVRLWDATDGKEIRVLRGHGAATYAVAFSRDGKTLASTDHNGTVKLWDWATGVETRSWQAHKGMATSVTFSRDGASLATGGADKTVRRWDFSTSQQIGNDLAHSGIVYQVAFSPNADRLGVVGTNGHLPCSFGFANTPQGQMQLHHLRRDGFVRLWNIEAEDDAVRISDQPHPAYGIVFSPDGSRIFVSTDRGLRIWDTSSGQELLTMAVGRGITHGVAIGPSGEVVAVTDANGNLSLADGNLRSHEQWRDLASIQRDDGRLLVEMRDEKASDAALHEALRLRQQVVEAQPQFAHYRAELAAAFEDLELRYRQFKQPEIAADALRQAMEARRTLVADFPSSSAMQEDLAWMLINHSFTSASGAEEACREGVRLLEQLHRERPFAPAETFNLADAQARLARLLLRSRRAAAEEPYRQAINLLQELAQQRPDLPTASAQLIALRVELARFLKPLGKRDEALASQRTAVDETEQLIERFPWAHNYRHDLARYNVTLGQLLVEAGQREKAVLAHSQTLSLLDQLVVDHPSIVVYRQDLARHHQRLAYRDKSEGRIDQAELAYQKALSLLEPLAIVGAPVAQLQECAAAQNQVGIFYFDQKRYDDAQVLYEKAMKMREKLASQSPSTAAYAVELGGTYCNLGHVYALGRKDTAAAATWYDKSVARLQPWAEKNAHPQARPFLFNAYQGRAEVHFTLRRWKDAIADFRQAIKLQPNNDSAKKRLAAALQQSVENAAPGDEPTVRDEKAQPLAAKEPPQAAIADHATAERMIEAGDLEQAITIYDKIIAAQPADAPLRKKRGDLKARLALWADAEDDYAFYARHNSQDFYAQMRLGILLAYLEKTEAYRVHCEALVARLQQQPGPDVATCFRSVKLCCYLASGMDRYERIELFADRVVQDNPDTATHWLAAGMAAHRLGKERDALKLLNTGLVSADRQNDVAAQTNILVMLGLVHQQLADKSAAQSCFDRAAIIASDRLRPENLRKDAVWWHDWLGYEVLRREAERLGAGESQAPQP